MLSTNFTSWLCRSALSIMQQHRQSCDSAVVHVSMLLTWCDSAVLHVTVLSFMGQCRHWCDGTVDVMRQCCQSCNSVVADVLALLTWCDSAVDCATVPSLMCWCCWCDSTGLFIMWQCHFWCDGTVVIMWQCRCWRVGTVNVMQQRCQSCDSVVIAVSALLMWCNSAVDHATVPPLMCWCFWRDETAILIFFFPYAQQALYTKAICNIFNADKNHVTPWKDHRIVAR